ncbi:gluconokinase [Cytobacillus eiseniae]|uniref:Gluconokinase n=1 Tax=Cytobacillus eiseniae TaxID=762947 RepID=A0ABS4RC61_9BACI|nr:gluconokinase [Cytobacillus eiseniae]MBP2240493.1 gluconokinase [Cytobacillus eiseniae]
MDKSIVIGLDIGTTSVKAVAFNVSGIVLAEHEVAYPLLTPFPSWAEQDPLEIEKAAINVIRWLTECSNIQSDRIYAIGLSSAMHSLICMNSKGEPLSPSITWADGRAAAEAAKLKEREPSIYEATGTPIHPMSPLVKLMWMKENKYEPYLQADSFVSIKEFLLYRWFGVKYVDYSIASATGLFDVHTLTWSEKALQIAGITEEKLFQPVPPTTVLEGLDQEIANQMGITMNLPFVIGASDGPLANLGIGAIDPGEVAITIGTSGAIRQLISTPKIDEQQQTFCYRFTDQLSLVGGPTNNGGIVLQWLKDTFGSNEDFDSFIALAAKVQPGAEELLFLPYLNGERAPMWNSKVRGNIFGLSLRHKKEHIVRAGLEGVIYSIYHVGQTLERLAGPPKKILASGGFARSPLWLQILADMFNQEVQVPVSHQSSSWGAAWLALYGIGVTQDLSMIKEHIPMKGQYMPIKENHEIYMEMFALYKELSETINRIR